MGLLSSTVASPSEERADRLTQAALDLDAHRNRGAEDFRRSCVRCHGDEAQGDARSGDPCFGGQRFKYIVRQLANFSRGERESDIMQRVVAHRDASSRRPGSTSPPT